MHDVNEAEPRRAIMDGLALGSHPAVLASVDRFGFDGPLEVDRPWKSAARSASGTRVAYVENAQESGMDRRSLAFPQDGVEFPADGSQRVLHVQG